MIQNAIDCKLPWPIETVEEVFFCMFHSISGSGIMPNGSGIIPLNFGTKFNRWAKKLQRTGDTI